MKKNITGFFLLFCFAVSAQQDNDSSASRIFAVKISHRIDSYFDSLLRSEKIGGAVVLAASGDSIFHLKPYGWSDKAAKIPMTENASFFITSMTKIVVIVAVLMLKDEGRLQLDDPVSKFIPDIAGMNVGVEETDTPVNGKKLRLEKVKTPMTIRHLLSNTAGFISSGWYEGLIADQYKRAAMWKYKNLRELVMAYLKIPLASQPGEAWSYDFAYNVLALIVETASGQPLENFFREKIFEPLGMRHTGYNLRPKDEPGAVRFYYLQEGKLMQQDPDFSKVDLHQGNTGLWSTATDFYKLCLMLLQNGQLDGKQVLRRETVEELFKDVEAGKDGQLLSWLPGYGYGCGFAIRVEGSKANFAGSEGELCWFGVLNTAFWIDPVKKIICVALTHISPTDNYKISKDLRDIIYSTN